MDNKKEENKPSSLFSRKIILVLLIVVLVGVSSGYLISRNMGGTNLGSTGEGVSGSSISKGIVVGSNDSKIFKDAAEGVLKKGGINGEGQYHLVRPGGDSQKVYLISSIVDLSKFLDRKIKVWGETQTAQTAGWLMDVGRVEVLE
ncbi:MAG: hypothetical protein Q7S38_01370 [bacterium]|nr:hypothetical protein [bacterium]